MYQNPCSLFRLDRRGFTLVELALVLSVFAIIIAGAIMGLANAMHNQEVNRLHQQTITTLENIRNYARRVDASTLNLSTTVAAQDPCNLGLLPADIATSGNCSAGSYTNALNEPIAVCAAGGTNTTQCGQGVTGMIAIILQNLSSADCVNLLSKLASNPNDLGFTQFIIGGTAFPTNTSTNLSPGTLGGTNACGAATTAASGTVNVEMDFSF